MSTNHCATENDSAMNGEALPANYRRTQRRTVGQPETFEHVETGLEVEIVETAPIAKPTNWETAAREETVYYVLLRSEDGDTERLTEPAEGRQGVREHAIEWMRSHPDGRLEAE